MSHDMSTLYELHSVTFHIESKKIHWSLIFERVNKKEDTPAIDIFFGIKLEIRELMLCHFDNERMLEQNKRKESILHRQSISFPKCFWKQSKSWHNSLGQI